MEEIESLDGALAALLPQKAETFSEMFGRIIRGEEVLTLSWLCDAVKESLLLEMNEFKYIFFSLCLLGIIAAVFHHCADVFQNKQIADLSFYFTYMLLISTLLQTFYLAMDITTNLIELIVRFMEILLPTYYVTYAATSAFSTAAGFYQLTLVLIYSIQSIFPTVMIPLISTYVFGAVISGLAQEDKLQSMLSLIKKTVQFILKLSVGLITGFGVVKSMVTPVIDGIRATGIQKVVSVVPGIGEVTETISKAVLGSAILIKNSLGLAILIGLISICIAPLCKLFVLAAVLKISASFMGLFADQRSFRCTQRIGEGCLLLLKSAGCVVAMLFITIAIVSVQTIRSY